MPSQLILLFSQFTYFLFISIFINIIYFLLRFSSTRKVTRFGWTGRSYSSLHIGSVQWGFNSKYYLCFHRRWVRYYYYFFQHSCAEPTATCVTFATLIQCSKDLNVFPFFLHFWSCKILCVGCFFFRLCICVFYCELWYMNLMISCLAWNCNLRVHYGGDEMLSISV